MYSLKYRISATIFILELIILSFVIWQMLSASIQSNYTQINTIQENTLKLVEQSARLALFTEEFAIIQLRMETIVEEPNVKRAMVVDHRNIIIASDNLAELGQEPPELLETEDTYWRTKIVGNSDNVLGSLLVQYSTRAQDEIYNSALNRGLIIAAIGLVFVALISLILGTILTRRISKVFKATDAVMGGNYSVRSGLKGNDEVGRLGIALDGMISHVADERERMAELNRELEKRVAERTRNLELLNNEIQSFSYSVSHDLRAPVRRIGNFADIFLEDYSENIDEEGQHIIGRIKSNSVDMMMLIDHLMMLSKVSHQEIVYVEVNLSEIFKSVLDELIESSPERNVSIDIKPDLIVNADKTLMKRLIVNLAENAWKYTGKTAEAKITFGYDTANGTYYVRDNGAGFNEQHAGKLFLPFERLHNDAEFEGSGIGLSTVLRIIERHNGEIWAKSIPNKETTFFFTLPD
jgi:signal transduction histidine kinase